MVVVQATESQEVFHWLVEVRMLIRNAPGIARGSLLGKDNCARSYSQNLHVAVVCRCVSSLVVRMHHGTGSVTPHSTKMARLGVSGAGHHVHPVEGQPHPLLDVVPGVGGSPAARRHSAGLGGVGATQK